MFSQLRMREEQALLAQDYALEQAEEKGLERGRAEGIEQGRAEGIEEGLYDSHGSEKPSWRFSPWPCLYGWTTGQGWLALLYQ